MTLDITLVVESKHGFYTESKVKAPHIKAVFDKLDSILDKIPDQIDGIDFIDWTRISIIIQRDQ